MEKSSRQKRTSLGEVARHAGVSLTTASLVLGNKGLQHRISEEVLQRVRHAAVELDYAPNRLVHSMQRGSTRILSFFNGFRNRDANDLYLDAFSSALERAAGRRGHDILVHCDFTRPPEAIYQHLNGGIVDGILFWAPQREDPLLPFLRASRLPTVMVSTHDKMGMLPGVRDDVASGMDQVAERLHALGHRRTAVFIEPNANPDALERALLLKQGLAARGIALPDHRVITYTGNVRDLLQSLLDEPEPPTALFCWRDRVAYWVLELCAQIGIAVPDRLTVVGYDGLRWPAATRHTPASVQVDFNLLADAAIDLLLESLEGNAPHPLQQFIPVTLTEGTTLGPPKSA